MLDRYLHNRPLRFAIIVFVVILFGLIRLRIKEPSATTLIGMSTFLFGTFSAYIVSHRQTRMVGIRSQANSERSALLNFYYLTLPLEDEHYKKQMAESIESYIQATQIHHVAYYYKTNYAFEKLVKTINDCDKKSPEGSAAYSNMLFGLSGLISARIAQVGMIGSKLSRLEWFIATLLASVMILSLLILNDGSLISIIIISVFIFAMDSLFYLMYNLDSLQWRVEDQVVEPYQKILDVIGAPRIYTNYMVEYGQAENRDHSGRPYWYVDYPHEYPNLKDSKAIFIDEKGNKESRDYIPDV